MKLTSLFVSVALFVVANAIPVSRSTFSLKDDLNDFVALLPIDQIKAIAMDYLANDEEVQNAVEFVTSEEFGKFILEIEAIPEYKQFLKYLQESGLDVYGEIQKLHDLLGLPPFVPKSKTPRRGTGIRGLVDDIKAILPIDKIKALYQEKLKTSPEFKNLIDRMSSDEFKKIVEQVRANPKFQELVKLAKDHGLDLDAIADLLNKIFGWGIETKLYSTATYNLKDDLNDFLALLPIDQIKAIAMDYLANDEEVQNAVEFVTSEEFGKFILEIEAIPEYKQFLKYLQESGLDVYGEIQKLHDLLGLPPFVPKSKTPRRGTGIRGLVDDIKAILPIDKIKALYQEKLQTSPEFKNLIDRMSSDEFKKIVEQVRANPKFQELVKLAKDHGLDLDAIADLLNKIFGWGIETKLYSIATYNLKDDLNDFLALLPIDQIKAIAMDYLANDEEVQNAVEFVTSEEFGKFILEIEAIPEYKQFLKYLQESGLDVYGEIQKLHDLLGLPPFVPKSKTPRRGTGIRGLVDDIKAILPIDKIKALYQEKLQTSPEFKNLIDRMSSDEFKKIVEQVRANPKFQELVKLAKDHGLDLDAIADLLNKIFGWGIETKLYSLSTYSLKDDLYDFLAILPLDEIKAIVMDYLANDEEVQNAVEFLTSEEFGQFILEIEAIPEYKAFLKYLQESGLDVYGEIQKLHDLLGLPPFVPKARSTRKGTGIRGLVDDIKAILPIDKIKALYQEKLQTSPEFKNLIDRMSSDEFKKIVEQVRANPKFQELVQRAKDHGLDMAAITDLLNKIFGWGLQK